MEKEFLSVRELSEILNLKADFLYLLVEEGRIPHFRIGRLIRFSPNAIHEWMEGNRREVHYRDKQVREAPKTSNGTKLYIDSILKKNIAQGKSMGYSKPRETRQEIKGLRKDGDDDGAL